MDFKARNVTPGGKRVLQVAFYETNGCGRCIQRFRHVELRFSDDTVTSITKDPGVVHYDQEKIMSSDGYSWFLQVTLEPYLEDRMQQKAFLYWEHQTRFANWALYWNFICCCFPFRGDNTLFCSQYITLLFQEAGMLKQLDSDRTTPTALFNALQTYDNVMFGSNTRRNRGEMKLHY